MLKKCNILIIVLLLIMFMTVITLGQGSLVAQKTNPDVWINAARVVYQNKDITNQLSPIIINGTTYLPMAKSAELFDKDITWDGTTKTITIKDKAAGQDRNTKRLEKEIGKLKSEVAEARIDKITNILVGRYDTYYGMKLKFSIKYEETDGYEEIVITINAKENEWNNIMTTSDEKAFVTKICEVIADDFEDIPIKGEVKDGKKIILRFTVDSQGTMRVRSEGMFDLEDALNKSLYSNKLGELSYINNKDLYIEVTGDIKDFAFYVRIHLDDYEKQWTKLSEKEIEEFLYSIYENILSKKTYNYTDIEGYFYDIDNNVRLVKCEQDAGRLRFTYYE
ncbi:MAG: hypothetical protein GX285_10400 [Clostridiales bacterium]|nr:hypothetical protein [Clostridiales bacterium]